MAPGVGADLVEEDHPAKQSRVGDFRMEVMLQQPLFSLLPWLIFAANNDRAALGPLLFLFVQLLQLVVKVARFRLGLPLPESLHFAHLLSPSPTDSLAPSSKGRRIRPEIWP